MSHYEDEDDFYGGSAQPGSGAAEVADDQQQLGTSFYNSNRPAPPAALRPGSQIFQGFSQPPPTASLPDLPANGAHSLRPIHQSSEHSEPPASFSHIQKPLPDPRKPHSEPAKRPVSEHQPPADPEEHSRTRVSSFFLGSKQPETEFIDEDAAAAHGPNNEVNQSASFNSPPDSDPSRVLSARRSSFYGLENPPPSSQSASPRHDQPIPRSQTAQSGMSVASFRKSATDHGQWGRRRRDRTVSNRSSNYASSSCGDSPVPPAVPRLNQPTHLRPGASASLLSHAKTLDLYRANVKKTNDVEVTFEFASFILNIVHDLADDELDLEEFRVTSVNALAGNRRSSILSSSKPKIPGLKASPSNADALTQQGGNTASASSSSSSISRSPNPSAPGQPGSAESTSRSSFDYDLADTKRNALIVEAAQLLKKCAERGHQKSQILLGQLHILGSLSADGQADWQRAFPFLLQAGKHDHYQSAFRVGQAYENGWGTKKDPSKAVQWYRCVCWSLFFETTPQSH